MDWPDNPFWDYALALYRRPGVEAVCLELQARHGLDANMVLFCCWLASRGIAPDRATLEAIAAAAERWQEAFVRPLRAVRSRLKTDLAQPRPGDVAARFSDLTAALRARVLAVEIDGERLEQLLLAELAADLAPGAVPGVALAGANLQRYRDFGPSDREALSTLLRAAFPEAAAGEIAAALEGAGR